MTHSIVIRAYNEERHIGKLLTGIMRQSVTDLDVVLVDSGSTDATVEIAKRFPVRVVSMAKEKFSFGRSLNLGLEVAKGDLVVLASAHVYPIHSDWIEQLLRPFSDETVALTYGKQRGDERSKFSEKRVFARWFPEDAARPTDYPFCNNANAAIRRSLWEGMPYNEELTGLEDLEWAKRVVASGHNIVYVPQAEVAHVHEETPLRIFHRYQREAMALRRIYPEQHFYLADLLRLLPTHVLRDALHAARQGVLLSELPEIVSFRAMQFLGTFKGFHTRSERADDLKATFYYPATWSEAKREAAHSRDARRISYGDTQTEEEPHV